MGLRDGRNGHLRSPTATTAVIRFLNEDSSLDPLEFAESCWDADFDIFGNWVFNVAEAYNRSKNSDYLCWVERYDDFLEILKSLESGFPTVISVRGPLPGSAKPYSNGHLLAVIGFDEKNKKL